MKNLLKQFMSRKINAAIIGLGIGLKHFSAINSVNNSKVVGIYDLDKKKSFLLKAKYPKLKIFNNENEIFKDKNINLVSIASYDEHHFRQISKCIQKEKNFIIEKPMCTTKHELKKITSLLKKNKKVKFISNLPLRTEPIFKYFKEKIKKQIIFHIEADYLWGRYKKLFQWRSKSKNYSIINGAAIHMIDIIIWLINDRPTHIFVSSNNIATINTKFKKNSFSIIILYFKNGLMAKVTANACSVSPHNHNVSIFSKNFTLRNDFYDRYIISKKGKKNLIKIKYPNKNDRHKLITSFIINLIDQKKPPLMTMKESLFLSKVCLAGIESEKKNKKIKIL